MMTDYSVHEPMFGGTTRDDWSAPEENGFDTDDLSDITGHCVLSASGFDDPERYEDRYLPVVGPDAG
jgi:hypothetical protein